jgi:predicted permease
MLCRVKKLISREGVNGLKQVVVNIALPAVLFHAFASTAYTPRDSLVPLLMFLACVAGWALGRAGAKLLRLPSRFVPFLTTGFEAGMLGYALFEMMYGAGRTAEFARIDLGQVLFVFTLYKVLLSLSVKEKADTGELIRDMAASPIVIAILAGVLLGATGLYQRFGPSGVSGVLDACTDFISAPAGALILLAIGYDLMPKDIPWRSVGKVIALRLGIMLALRLAVGAAVGLLWPQADLSDALNVMFILPPPFVLPVFAGDGDQRAFVSSVLSVSTLVTVAGFVALAASGV